MNDALFFCVSGSCIEQLHAELEVAHSGLDTADTSERPLREWHGERQELLKRQDQLATIKRNIEIRVFGEFDYFGEGSVLHGLDLSGKAGSAGIGARERKEMHRLEGMASIVALEDTLLLVLQGNILRTYL